jgi:uncharacterized protein (TIGR00369 family)
MGDERSNIEEIRERFARSEFHTTRLGLSLDRIGPGEADVSLEIGSHHQNLMGTLHGGMIAVLADTATGVALGAALGPGRIWTTTSLNLTFLAPGRSGRVSARARVVKSGRQFGYAEADVVDAEDHLLARAAATFAIMPERPAQ